MDSSFENHSRMVMKQGVNREFKGRTTKTSVNEPEKKKQQSHVKSYWRRVGLRLNLDAARKNMIHNRRLFPEIGGITVCNTRRGHGRQRE